MTTDPTRIPAHVTDEPTGIPLLLLVGAVFLALTLTAYTCTASSRWTPETAARLELAWPDVEAAAELAGVDPLTLGAQAVTETAVRPLEGHYAPVLGVLQVCFDTWRWLLWGAGWDDSDLMDPVWSWYASAEVLAYLSARYGRSGPLLQCLWSDGTATLGYRKDCLYSRQVARHRAMIGRTR